MSENIIRADAEPDTPVVFDYSGLDAATCAAVRNNTAEFASHMMSSVAEYGKACVNVLNVHDALANHHGGKWRSWCASSGLSVGGAQRMLNVGRSLLSCTNLVQLIEDGAIGKCLLQAISEPSAPAELVQAVKDGGITSNKQYQELLAKYKAERERADDLGAEVLDRDAQISQLADSCQQAETARDAAEAKARRAQEIKDVALDEVKAARAAQAEAMAEARRVRSDLELADRKAEGYKQQVAELDQEASEMQDAIDDLRIENESLKAAMAAAPVAPAVVDQDEVDRRVREGVAAALADEEARWAEAVEAQQTTIRRLKETAGLAGQIKAAGEAVIAVLESLLARLDPAELDGPAVRSLDELSDTLDRYAGRLYDAVEADGPDDESEED